MAPGREIASRSDQPTGRPSMHKAMLAVIFISLASVSVEAQDRDTKVRNDRRRSGAKDWIYNDLDEGIRAAKAAGKPLLVVFRCIPCEACQEFDDDVARRDPIVRDLLDEFVCVRIVQANTIDLTPLPARLRPVVRRLPDEPRPDHLRPVRHPLRAARARGHLARRAPQGDGGGAADAPRLCGGQAVARRQAGQARPATRRRRTIRAWPASTARRSTTRGQAAKSCMHCHQIGEAERLVYRTAERADPGRGAVPLPRPGACWA